MEEAALVAGVGEMGNAHKIVVGKPVGKILLLDLDVDGC
jgi:hypothetical protein